MRVRLDIAYDGTDFSGWAVQPAQRTVAGALTDALSTVLRAPAELTVAGRTDAGVHATGQVAHLDVDAGTWSAIEVSLVRRLAGVLPADIRVRAARAVPSDFDARFAALSRRYAYRVCEDPAGVPPLFRRDTLAHPRPLDEDAMRAASSLLLGEHDFVAFCRRREGASTIRGLQHFDWARAARTDDQDPPVLVATVQADAFCHSMVRSLVGAVLAVGEGRRPVGWPAELLTATSRASAVPVAPAHGLTLIEVCYPAEDRLAQRTAVTRRRRDGGAHPSE